MPARKQLYNNLPDDTITRSLMKSEYKAKEIDILQNIWCTTEPSKRENAFLRYLSTYGKTLEEKSTLKALWRLCKAKNKHKVDNFVGAAREYQEAFRAIFQGEARYLKTEFYNSDYIAKFKPEGSWRRLANMVMCCGGIAQCCMELKDYFEALKWFDETEVLYGCIDLRFANESETYKTLRYYTDYMHSRLAVAGVFTDLGNTATAAYYSEQARVYRIPDHLILRPGITDIMEWSKTQTFLSMRHPPLEFVDDWDVEHDLLQVRGIWSKLLLRSRFCPRGRRLNVCWIWRSRLYIHGGAANSFKSEPVPLTDTWCIDLKKLDKWTRLPDVPARYRNLALYGRRAVVYDDYAWIFTGHRDILRFDMISNSWDQVATTVQSRKGHKWPYSDNGLRDQSIALLDHYMYVFGGNLQGELDGSDIFMVLDLKSLRWRYLGDSSLYKRADHPGRHWPPPRRNAGCWIVPNEKRLYVLYGTQSFHDYLELYDSEPSCDPYNADMWSYSIDDEIWTRERLRGNFPCPRESMGITYHPTLNSVILFGGVNQYMHSYTEYPEKLENSNIIELVQNKDLYPDTPNSYFGDTFIMDMSSLSWRQVVTRSFPSWMSGAQCFVDESTGDTFLYGGYGIKEYIAQEKSEDSTYRYFSDIHRLDIEHPGSRFRMDEFLAGSMNYLKFGCWRRCYTCKDIGKGFYKCKGSCGGRYIYCSIECQREGWEEHKAAHGCRRVC